MKRRWKWWFMTRLSQDQRTGRSRLWCCCCCCRWCCQFRGRSTTGCTSRASSVPLYIQHRGVPKRQHQPLPLAARRSENQSRIHPAYTVVHKITVLTLGQKILSNPLTEIYILCLTHTKIHSTKRDKHNMHQLLFGPTLCIYWHNERLYETINMKKKKLSTWKVQHERRGRTILNYRGLLSIPSWCDAIEEV